MRKLITKTEKSYLISYKELKEKFGITERIEFITNTKHISDTGDMELDYAIEVGVKE